MKPVDTAERPRGIPTRTGLRLGFLMALAGVLTCDWITGPENQAPQAAGRIPDQVVEVDSTAVLDLSAYFSDPEGDTLTYTAISGAPETATATVSGSALRVTGLAAGETMVTVTARDPDSLAATQSFAVTVPNRVPVVADTIPDGEVFVDSLLVLDAAAFFADPDGDELAYAAVSSDTTRATVAVSASTVTVAGMAVGSTTVTVTARDPGGLEVAQEFAVTVPNQAPAAVDSIGDHVLEVDSVAVLAVAPFFADPDRDSLEYSAVTADSGRVAVVVAGDTLTLTGVAKGSVGVTVIARDPGGLEAEQHFGVTVPNRTPMALDAITGQEVFVGDGIEIDVAAHFTDPDGDSLVYVAVSSDTTRAVVAVAGGVVVVTGVAVGAATVTVTAADTEGLTAEQEFVVTIPNRAPAVADTIPDREVFVDSLLVLDAAAYFADPDGHELAYAAVSSDTTRATVAMSAASTVTVTGMAVGSTTVTVTARDPGGLEVAQGFAVTVPNRAPAAVDSIEDRVLEVDSVTALAVAPFFADPDRDSLEYSAVSADTGRVLAVVAGDTLTLTGVAKGSAGVTVTARDPGGLEAVQGFVVTVPNRTPVAVGTIGDRVVEAVSSIMVDLEGHFSDPDGDALDYAAVSSDPTRATAAVSGTAVTVTGVAGGSATIMVTARDSGGLSATHQFGVTVPNRAPESIAAIQDQAVARNGSTTLDLSKYFNDPDGDRLSYSAVSSRQSRATVSVSGATLTISGKRPGTVTITVTASDPAELSVTGSFRVRVVQGNLPPRAVGSVGDRSLGIEETLSINVSSYFTDPEGQNLRFRASSSRPATATVALSGSTLTVTGAAAGTATITVTARDPGNLSATQRFGVTVQETAAASDLVVTTVSANPNVVGPGEPFSLRATVRNRGPGGASSVTTLRYYLSTDRNISTGDTEVGTDGVPVLGPSGNSAQSLALAASTTVGTYYYGACVDPVGNESQSNNNCSSSVTVHVTTSNRAPRAVGTITGRRLEPGDAVAIDVAPYFSDPDGDDLTYTAGSSNPAAASVALSGSTVTATAVAAGTATITVTATDPGGLTANQRFEVTVQAPGQSDLVVQPPTASANSLGPGETLTLRVVVENQGTGDASSGTTLRYYLSFDATIGAGDNQVGTDNVPALGASETSAQSITLVVPSAGGTYYYGACADAAGNESSTDNNCSSAVEVVVVVPNRSPSAVGTIPNQSVGIGNSVSVDAESYFTDPDDDDLTYTATSDSPTLVTVTVSGSRVELTGVAEGEAIVTVRATDPGNLSATQRFTVTATEDNLPPTVDVQVTDFSADPGGVVYGLTLTDIFSDPNGDDLTWSTSSSNTNVVLAEIVVDTILLTTGEIGRANIIVAATDPDGLSAADTFTVTVTGGNQAPTVDVPIGDFSADPDGVVYVLTLTDYFSDPDGDDLTWSASSSNTNVVSPKILVDTLDLTTGVVGRANIIVTATDPDGLSAADTFTVTVTRTNRAPTVDVPIGDFSADPDGVVYVLTLTDYFSDPDGDDLSWSASSSNTNVVSLEILAGTDTLDLTTGSVGRARIIVAATDPGGLSAADTFTVTVTRDNRAPTVHSPIGDLNNAAGNGVVYGTTLTDHFSDPDGDDLSWSVSSSATAVVSPEIVVDTLLLTTGEAGTANIIVTATDPGGLFVADTHTVTVVQGNRAPKVDGSIGDFDASPSEVYKFTLTDVFSDPDGDDLTWSASSSNNSRVRTSIVADTLRVSAIAEGRADITVTATDPDDLSATDNFRVTVLPPANFDIDIEWWADSPIPSSKRKPIRDARDRWEAALKPTELRDLNLTSTITCGPYSSDSPSIDDHRVIIGLATMDGRGGTLAKANYCLKRGDNSPALSRIRIDEDDINHMSNDILERVIIHELAHALGFSGSHWELFSLVDTGSDPHFKGSSAIAAFNAAGGTSYTGNKVPISTDHSHWRESVFVDEIMTPYISDDETDPVSAITLQAMADIGYTVDLSQADDFTLSLSDLAPSDTTGEVFDLTNDVDIGPVMVVDSLGRILRVIPPPGGAVRPSSGGAADVPEIVIDRRERETPRGLKRIRPRLVRARR